MECLREKKKVAEKSRRTNAYHSSKRNWQQSRDEKRRKNEKKSYRDYQSSFEVTKICKVECLSKGEEYQLPSKEKGDNRHILCRQKEEVAFESFDSFCARLTVLPGSCKPRTLFCYSKDILLQVSRHSRKSGWT
ncbi:hypothetical protein CEXT_441231 [Caerostris extrusa]|uniref:Uncharacterized protein n=1 Tax=Caerostris extrusa TaxID=172846 RepID=A0AAV4S2X6_CAEEX|nr:hypothetical protein CEXT_441231 [Caerostris extrusa]